MRKSKTNKLLLPLALFICLSVAIPCTGEPRRVDVSTTAELYAALAAYDPADTSGIHIRLAPGAYALNPSPLPPRAPHMMCDPYLPRVTEMGLHITGKRVIISGTSSEEVVLRTGPGSGVYFDDCDDCALVDVAVVADDDEGPDALITADHSRLEVRNCVIRGYARAAAVHAVGFESDLTLMYSEIRSMSADGILLDGVKTARIQHNVIEGYRAQRETGSDGEAAGIRVVCYSHAEIEKNLIRNFDMGIAVDCEPASWLFIHVNFIEEMRAYGIATFGSANTFIDENVVFRCGACGVKIDTNPGWNVDYSDSGRMWRNFIVHTAQNPEYDDGRYCYQCPLALHEVPEGFEFKDNTFYDNRRVSEHAVSKDRVREWFWRKRRPYLRKYRNTKIGVDGRHSFWDSSFLQRYSRF